MNNSEIINTVKNIISNVVQNKKVNADTRLSSLNLDSMTMVLLASEIEDKYNIGIDPSMIYDLDTVDDIAVFISKEIDMVTE